MRSKISAALKDAIKAQDKRRSSTLRLIMAAIKDRDISARSKGREAVSDDEILEILAKMIKQRRESVATYEQAGRLELAQQEQQEIDIISEFLPQQMSDDEIAEAAKQTVEEIGATGLTDMGQTMAALKKKFAGRMDFGKASKVVKALLSS